MKFVVSTLSNAFALWVAVFLLGGLSTISDGSLGTETGTGILIYLAAGAILAVVNIFVRPIVKLLSLPLYILTLGLYFVVVNALMIMMTSWLSHTLGIGVVVAGFWWAVLAGIVVGIVNWFISLIVAK